MNSILPLPEDKGVQILYYTDPNKQFRNLVYHESFREKKNAPREMERLKASITWRESEQEFLIREQTKVEDILKTIIHKTY